MDNSILLIDIGNSTISWEIDGVYNSLATLKFSANLIPKYQRCLISCVGNSALITMFNHAEIIKPQAYENLNFDYDLNQLGVDRFLAIIAAFERYPEQDLMIIDIGTFVTIDIIKNHQHISGGIAPGLDKLRAVQHFQGFESENAWRLGTKAMLIAYIKKQCACFQGRILITGGGQNLLKINHADYYQNLVIDGLKIISSAGKAC